MLQHIHRVTYFFNQEIQSSHQTTRERMNSIEKRIEIIEKQEQDVRKNMAARLEDQTKLLHAKLNEHIQSIEFGTKFCNWKNCSFPPNEINWEITKSNIKKAIDYRFKELLIQWENDNQVYSEMHRKLLDEFRTRLDTCFMNYIIELRIMEAVHAPKNKFHLLVKSGLSGPVNSLKYA